MQLAMLDKVKKSYKDRVILDIKKFEIIEGDRIGIVGCNGVGKTTLLKILIGEESVDEGKVFITDSYSYVSQQKNFLGECLDSKAKSVFNAPTKYEDYLSGGEKVKLKISEALTENTSLIILDEPTSNLDSKSIDELKEMLKDFKGTLLIVSHDRSFLNELCTSIVEIENGKLTQYSGDYNTYSKLKSEKRKREEKEYCEYKKEKIRLEKAIEKKEELRERINKAPKGMGQSEAKTIKMGDQSGKKTLDNNIKSIKNRIKHMDVKEKPKKEIEIKINIQKGKEMNSKHPIAAKNLTLCIEDKVLLNDANFSIERGKKVAIIGENGCGKTTLIREILNRTNDNIHVCNTAYIGYFDQSQNILNDNKSILENVKMNSSYDNSFIMMNLNHFGFNSDGVNKLVSELSGGEKVKAAICKVILCDNNMIILDEPTNYLDVKSIESLENALISTDKTVIVVSHDKAFISNVCDYIMEFKDKRIEQFDGSYNEYLEYENKLINKVDKEHDDELLVLENRLSETISLLSIETDEEKKSTLNNEYINLISKIKKIKV